MKKKIHSISSIIKKIEKFKKSRKSIVLCHGVFDLIHIGHIKHFEEAKNHGSILVVSVTPDVYVKKGPNRPVFNENLRVEALNSIEYIDYIFINKWPTAIETINKIKPEVYFKGPDYKKNRNDLTGKIVDEKKAIKKVGGQIKFSRSETFSSSNLLNNNYRVFDENQKVFLTKIKNKFNFEKINEIIDSFKKYTVLTIGESIIDEYVFCDVLGKSGKEPIITLKQINSEKYLGGSLAIANHLSDFVKKISLVTYLGEKKDYNQFINKKLKSNIYLNSIAKKNSPTIVKKRYVDYISKNKFIGVYSLDDNSISQNEENKIISILKTKIKNADLVIVSDFGHGLITKKIAQYICKNSKFLSVNAQINSSNIGYNSISKYSKIDSLIINENELRHYLRDRDSDVKILLKKLIREKNIKNIIVTRGKIGAMHYNYKSKQFVECPAFANKIIDKIGSGDAMLSLISLCLKLKLEINLSLFLGSIAAAQSVESIGNSLSVSKSQMLKEVDHMLK